jgi:hypothetical protein
MGHLTLQIGAQDIRLLGPTRRPGRDHHRPHEQPQVQFAPSRHHAARLAEAVDRLLWPSRLEDLAPRITSHGLALDAIPACLLRSRLLRRARRARNRPRVKRHRSPFPQALGLSGHVCVMGHDGHSLVHHRALKAFVTHLTGTASESTGDVAVHHGATLPSGTSPRHMVRGSLTAAACLVEEVETCLGRRRGVDRRGGLGDADGQKAARMEGLTQGGIMATTIARHVDLELLGRAAAVDGTLALVAPGPHSAARARVARWYGVGPEKARGRFREHPRLSTERGGAMALACHAGGDGPVVRMDALTVAELLTGGAPP